MERARSSADLVVLLGRAADGRGPIHECRPADRGATRVQEVPA